MTLVLRERQLESGRQRSAQMVVITCESATRGLREQPRTITRSAAYTATLSRSSTSYGFPV